MYDQFTKIPLSLGHLFEWVASMPTPASTNLTPWWSPEMMASPRAGAWSSADDVGNPPWVRGEKSVSVGTVYRSTPGKRNAALWPTTAHAWYRATLEPLDLREQGARCRGIGDLLLSARHQQGHKRHVTPLQPLQLRRQAIAPPAAHCAPRRRRFCVRRLGTASSSAAALSFSSALARRP